MKMERKDQSGFRLGVQEPLKGQGARNDCTFSRVLQLIFFQLSCAEICGTQDIVEENIYH